MARRSELRPGGWSRLELLIADYQEARDDERQLEAVQAAILAITLGSFFGVLTILATVGDGESLAANAVYALSPLAIFVPASVGQWVAGRAVLRSFYLRALEHELRYELNALSLEGQDVTRFCHSYPGLWSLSITDLMVQNGTMKKVGSQGGLLLMGIVGSYAIGGGALTYISLSTLIRRGESTVAAASGVFFLLISLLLAADVWRVNLRGRRFFSETVKSYGARVDGSLLPVEPPENGRQNYSVVLPKPDDLGKGLFAMAGIGAALGDLYFLNSGTAWLRPGLVAVAVAVSIAFEVLVYQTRYIVNDLLDVEQDDLSAGRLYRGRIPANEHDVRRVVRGALVRFGVVIVFLSILRELNSDLFSSLLLAVVVTLIATVLYEACRKLEGIASAGWWRTSVAVAIHALVLVGYPVRVYVGYASYVDILHARQAGIEGGFMSFDVGPWVVSVGDFGVATLLWSLGTGLVFVSLTWLLEALDELKSAEGGKAIDGGVWRLKAHIFLSWRALRRRTSGAVADPVTRPLKDGSGGMSPVGVVQDWRDDGVWKPVKRFWAAACTPWSLGSLGVSIAVCILVQSRSLIEPSALQRLGLIAVLWVISMLSECSLLAGLHFFPVLGVAVLVSSSLLAWHVWTWNALHPLSVLLISVLMFVMGAIVWYRLLGLTSEAIHGWFRKVMRLVVGLPRLVEDTLVLALLPGDGDSPEQGARMSSYEPTREGQ